MDYKELELKADAYETIYDVGFERGLSEDTIEYLEGKKGNV